MDNHALSLIHTLDKITQSEPTFQLIALNKFLVIVTGDEFNLMTICDWTSCHLFVTIGIELPKFRWIIFTSFNFSSSLSDWRLCHYQLVCNMAMKKSDERLQKYILRYGFTKSQSLNVSLQYLSNLAADSFFKRFGGWFFKR